MVWGAAGARSCWHDNHERLQRLTQEIIFVSVRRPCAPHFHQQSAPNYKWRPAWLATSLDAFTGVAIG
jgi:hypothetical protein